MDYKEKYEQALKRARQFSEKPYLEDSAGIVEYIFPELAESEEKIRKALIKWFESYGGQNLEWFDGLTPEKAIAYLENQGEQKHIPWYDLEKSKEAGYTIVPNEEYEKLIKNAEWSKKDEFMRRQCIGAIQLCNCCPETKDGILDWLKSLKGRVQPRQEWSEDDEEIRKSIIDRIERRRMSSIGSECAICENQIDWLKSLRPQLHWKPSDDKMWALSTLVNIPESASDTCRKTVQELLEELKKLREE